MNVHMLSLTPPHTHIVRCHRPPRAFSDEWREWDKIKTLIQTIQVANQTATILCLVHLLDCDLAAPIAHDAFIKFGGMQMLVNLLSCDDRKCRIGALKVLRALVSAPYMQAYMEQLNGEPVICVCVCVCLSVCVSLCRGEMCLGLNETHNPPHVTSFIHGCH